MIEKINVTSYDFKNKHDWLTQEFGNSLAFLKPYKRHVESFSLSAVFRKSCKATAVRHQNLVKADKIFVRSVSLDLSD